MSEVKRGRGRPRKIIGSGMRGAMLMEGDETPIVDLPDELDLRERLVKTGIATQEVVAQLDLATVKEMLAEAKEDGIPADTNRPVVVKDLVAAEIIRGLMDLTTAGNRFVFKLYSGGGTLLESACQGCEEKPDYLKEQCVCHDARKFLALMGNG